MTKSRHGFRGATLCLACTLFTSAGCPQPTDDDPQPTDDRPHQVRRYDPGSSSPAPPEIPDSSAITADAVLQTIPASSADLIIVEEMATTPKFDRFLSDAFVPLFSDLQGLSEPLAIFVASGVYTLEEVANEVNDSSLLQQDGSEFTLKVPLFVLGNASLIIAGPEVSLLKMTEDTGALLSNHGDLYVVNSSVQGWNDAGQRSATYKSSATFRPFLTTWTGGRMFIAASILSHLGFNEIKTYGVTYAAASENRLEVIRSAPAPYGWAVKEEPPTGCVVECTISDTYYGFYCFEASDISVVGNVYRDNIVYGIDPHDFSTRLLIADNIVTGTLERDGIILSRGVSDSWIVGNTCEGNALSGIKLDRRCIDNLISSNVLIGNGGDGISLFESENNTIWANEIRDNQRSGVRVRNSWDITLRENVIESNLEFGVLGSTSELTGRDPQRPTDQYEERVGATIEFSILTNNVKGALKFDNFETLRLAHLDILPSSNAYLGDLSEYAADIEAITIDEGTGIELVLQTEKKSKRFEVRGRKNSGV